MSGTFMCSILTIVLHITYGFPCRPGWLVSLPGPCLAISGYRLFCLSKICSLQKRWRKLMYDQEESLWWLYHYMALVKYTLLFILTNVLWFTYASPSCPGWLVCLAGPRLAISGYWPFCLSVVCSLQWGENTVKLWFWVLVCDYVISLHDSSNVHTVVFCIVM